MTMQVNEPKKEATVDSPKRQQDKKDIEFYKEKAKGMYPTARVSPTAHVHLMTDGAFVQVDVWVPVTYNVCTSCNATGVESDTKQCADCKGVGLVRNKKSEVICQCEIYQTCDICRGTSRDVGMNQGQGDSEDVL